MLHSASKSDPIVYPIQPAASRSSSASRIKESYVLRVQGMYRISPGKTDLAAPALLHPQVGSAVGGAVAAVPVDGLLGVGAVALDSEPGLAVVGEVALLVDPEVQGAGAVWHGTGVRDGHAQRSGVVLNDVQALERSGDAVLGGEGDGTIGGGVDWAKY